MSTSIVTQASRDPWFDNAKIAILALVVAGHVIEHWIAGSAVARAIYASIYLFHMPAIALVSGAISVRVVQRGAQIQQAARFTLIYLAAQAVLLPIYQALHGTPIGLQFTRPVFALWFLPALAMWTLLAGAFLRLPAAGRVAALAASVAAALCAGLLPWIDATMSASRIIVFLPFFLAGAGLGPAGVAKLASLRRPAAILLGALAAMLALLSLVPALPVELLLGRDSFANLGLSGAAPLGFRGAHLLLAALATIGFLGIVPRRRFQVTAWGARTLEIYLLHAVVIYAARVTGLLPAELSTTAVATGFALWTGTLWAFSRPGVAQVLRPALSPARRRHTPQLDLRPGAQ